MQSLKTMTTLEIGKLKELRGSRWNLNGEELHISDERNPYSKTAMRLGGEAPVIPLFADDGCCRWYFKVFTNPKAARKLRAEWLVRERIAQWTPELWAAPTAWVDTRISGRPDGCKFDMEGYLAPAASGKDWRDYKFEVVESELTIRNDIRHRWVTSLIRTIATLEKHGLVHGDLSPANLIVNPDTGALFLIDFDAFVSDRAPREFQRLLRREGGAIGTPDYMPVDLEEQKRTDDEAACPYSDRRARDLLLLELLCFDHTFPKEEASSTWEHKQYQHRLKKVEPESLRHYLQQPDILTRSESDRLSSQQLAESALINTRPQVQSSCFSRGASFSGRDQTWHQITGLVRQALTAIYTTQCAMLLTKVGNTSFASTLSSGRSLPTEFVLGWSLALAAGALALLRLWRNWPLISVTLATYLKTNRTKSDSLHHEPLSSTTDRAVSLSRLSFETLLVLLASASI